MKIPISFGLTRSGLEATFYHTRGKHTYYYTTETIRKEENNDMSHDSRQAPILSISWLTIVKGISPPYSDMSRIKVCKPTYIYGLLRNTDIEKKGGQLKI